MHRENSLPLQNNNLLHLEYILLPHSDHNLHLLNILRELKITAPCEGVETAEQCRYLIRMGCQKVQGFYFSKPVPVEQFYHTYQALNGCYAIRAELAAQQ